MLSEIAKTGKDVRKEIRTVAASPDEIPMDILRFVNDNRPLEVTKFYERLRASYNAKRSSLYYNIVSEAGKDSPMEALATLHSLSLQILLHAKRMENQAEVPMFLSHARAEEITRVLNNYYATFDLKPCLALLRLIKADCGAFHSLAEAKGSDEVG